MTQKPGNINALTARLIERIKNLPWAEKFVLGRGLALAHYLEFRPTNDADCWWEENTPETEKEETLNTIAGWRDILDRFPLPNHLAYHTLRALLHMPPVPGNLLELPYERFDTQENREDPCLLLVFGLPRTVMSISSPPLASWTNSLRRVLDSRSDAIM